MPLSSVEHRQLAIAPPSYRNHLFNMTSKSHPYAVAGIPVLHKPSPKPHKIEARYNGINPGIATLPAGYKKEPDCRPFEVATIFEQNIKIPLRDGTVLRGDVFRPANKADVPVILTFSPYGKSGTGELLNLLLRS
jgi:predicted acyl esterase